MKTKSHLHRFARFLLVYTLLVILWGAWVRISHSGDGCGASWPLCKGQIIPEAQQNKTWVEFSHRMTSGLFGLLVIYLFWQGHKLTASGSILRKALVATLIFMITEALLGAKLVLFGLVGNNDSVLRLFMMGLHQLNSLLLSGSVAMVALFSSSLPEQLHSELHGELHGTSPVPARKELTSWIFGMLVLFVAVAVTGAFASLSTTLFPSSSLMEGLAKDFAPDAHYLLRVRISHPILATLVGGGIALLFWIKSQDESHAVLRKATVHVAIIFALGVLFGYMTLISLAPIWMKVTHLLLAHLIWISLLRWYALKKIRA